MALFLTILEGDTPEKARPLIATRDKEIIRLVTVEIARLKKWSDRRILRVCSSLRDLEGDIGLISSELAKYEIGDATPNENKREQLWSDLKRAYETRARLEQEFDVLSGSDEQAKLELWRSRR